MKQEETKVSSKNSLESSVFNIKVTIENNKLQGKINDMNKVKILESVIKSSVGWIRKNQTADRKEFEHQQKELEKDCNPIIIKLYQSARGLQKECLGASPIGELSPQVVLFQSPPFEEVNEVSPRRCVALFHRKTFKGHKFSKFHGTFKTELLQQITGHYQFLNKIVHIGQGRGWITLHITSIEY